MSRLLGLFRKNPLNEKNNVKLHLQTGNAAVCYGTEVFGVWGGGSVMVSMLS